LNPSIDTASIKSDPPDSPCSSYLVERTGIEPVAKILQGSQVPLTSRPMFLHAIVEVNPHHVLVINHVKFSIDNPFRIQMLVNQNREIIKIICGKEFEFLHNNLS